MTQAESPEWTPANSMCSMTAGRKVSFPSEMASASHSMALSRNLSMRIGRSGVTPTAFFTLAPDHLLVVDHFHASAAPGRRTASA